MDGLIFFFGRKEPLSTDNNHKNFIGNFYYYYYYYSDENISNKLSERTNIIIQKQQQYVIMKSSLQTRPTAMSLLWLLFGVISIRLPNGHAWIPSPPPFGLFASRTSSPTTTQLHDASEGAEGDQHPKQHVSSMPHYHRFQEQVRTLQHSFYQSTPASCLDPSTGQVSNLPVWKVPWTEVPGRSHILQVDEPLYTGLFSSILARGNTKDQPWYFGSLYQAQSGDTTTSSSSSGSKVLSQPPDPHQTTGALTLEAWQDDSKHDSTTPVLGTLMRIADYRRLQDGRLFLLVEAMERFVVTNVQQELPYGIATVQLIPDAEEVDPNVNDWIASSAEDQIGEARSGALAESFQRYHRYEYDETFRLPPPNDYVKHNSQFLRSLLTLVVPYVPLSKTVDLETLRDVPLDMTKPAASDTNVEDDDKQNVLPPQQQQQPCLEQQLLQDNILKDYRHPDVSVQQMSLDDLEYRLWMEVNHFLKATKTPVSPVLLGLIPLSHHPSTTADVVVGDGGDNIDICLEEKNDSKECSKEDLEERPNDPNKNNIQWPSNFSLRKIADEIAKSDYKHNFVQVSPALPQYRRLRKLSYSLTAVLEEHNNTTSGNFRQELLEIVSTRARLERILERLESQNSDIVWGEFE